MTEKNYLTIQGFMRTKLNLKGNELLVYALIYGFSQDGKTWFTGSANYIAEWVGITRQNVMAILKRLVEKELIIKQDKVVNGVKLVDYKVNTEMYENNTPCKETLHPCNETLHQNINDTYIKETVSKDTVKKKTSYDSILDKRGITGKKRDAVLEYIKMRKFIKKPMTEHALELALNNLDKLANSEEEQIAILEQSISNSWQGLFPLKKTESTGNNEKHNVAHKPNEYKDFDIKEYYKGLKQ